MSDPTFEVVKAVDPRLIKNRIYDAYEKEVKVFQQDFEERMKKKYFLKELWMSYEGDYAYNVDLKVKDIE